MKKEQSPTPPARKQVQMSFPDAIKAILEGKKVTRLEWSDPTEYGILKDSFLMIHRKEKFHSWIVSEGDMSAIDWVVMK